MEVNYSKKFYYKLLVQFVLIVVIEGKTEDIQ